MRQHDRDHQRVTGSEDSIWTVLPVALIVVLMVGVLTMGVLRTFNFGPSVGDVIVFAASHSPGPADGLPRADMKAARAGSAASNCVLSPATMAAEGGSLVVEGSIPHPGPVFLVHWAGHRTSGGADDCGSTADLLLPPADLLDLAAYAGGFGVGRQALTTATSVRPVPTVLD
jgi:hypothetical protein